jgi:hypothetical protein
MKDPPANDHQQLTTFSKITRKGGMDYDVRIIWWLEAKGSDKPTCCDRSFCVSMQQFAQILSSLAGFDCFPAFLFVSGLLRN